jgi:hypothetical protein
VAWQDPRETEYIVLHHSAQSVPMQKDWHSIRRLHLPRFQLGIGYPRIMERDGAMMDGRKIQMVGAHAPPNRNRFGLCGIGWNEGLYPESISAEAAGAGWKPNWAWSERQWQALIELHLPYLIQAMPGALICGHNQLCATLCPGFDVPAVLMERGWQWPERLFVGHIQKG